MDYPFLLTVLMYLIRGLPLTFALAFASLLAGACLALVLALMQQSTFRGVSFLARTYIFVFRGTPLLVQIFLIYYGLGQFRPALQALGLWGFLREPYWCAILALSMNTAAYTSEIIRGGWQSVNQGEVEAARACGMSGTLLFRRIIVPLALRQALPAYGSEMILMVKATSLASMITLMEVTGLAAKLIAQTFRVLEIFAVAGSIYLIINFLISRLVMVIEWRISPHLRVTTEVAKAESIHV